jgi:beta-lactamase regulating signal transducer with metallopeptidase domain
MFFIYVGGGWQGLLVSILITFAFSRPEKWLIQFAFPSFSSAHADFQRPSSDASTVFQQVILNVLLLLIAVVSLIIAFLVYGEVSLLFKRQVGSVFLQF